MLVNFSDDTNSDKTNCREKIQAPTKSEEIGGKEDGILRLSSRLNKMLLLRTDLQFGGKHSKRQHGDIRPLSLTACLLTHHMEEHSRLDFSVCGSEKHS